MNTKFLLGLLAGAAVGAIAGVLFAPDKGSETRQRLIDKGDSYAKNMKSKFDKFKNRWSSEYARENEFRGETVSPSI